jgi:hypothetical protein
MTAVDLPAFRSYLFLETIPPLDKGGWVAVGEKRDLCGEEGGKLLFGFLHVEEEEGEPGETSAKGHRRGPTEEEGEGDGEMV